ncbi:hypothetical protein [Candidatus Berkiella aquae]|uniref:Uncharacterized protein n=1 Tax=Candidatus Berkiella aquae TaxID=295108 RepID=A0A0Q9YMW2_9GAMM|nr:hypothetical protein [Candidatus Berkiella aquae]MCS5712686.1 hypothetical protein [Candidatus Berkiella aquae]
MPNTNELYTKVAADGAQMIWHTIGKILPQVGALFVADKIGDVADWAQGKQDPSTEQKSFASRLNPLNWFRNINPVSTSSFLLTPLKGGKKFIGWTALEGLLAEYQGEIEKHWQKLAPIGEKFLKPFVEKVTTPFIDYLQNQGLMQATQNVEIVCECPMLPEQTFAAVKQAATMPGETGSTITGLLSSFKDMMTTPFSEWGSAAKDIGPTPLEQVFQQDTPTQLFQEVAPTIRNVITPVTETIKEQTSQYQNHFMRSLEQRAEPTARFMADACSSAYNGISKLSQKPNDVYHAVESSVHLIAEALGIHPGWVVAAGVGITSLAGYGLYSGLQGWSSSAATAQATATGGKANATGGNGGNVNLLIQFPQQTQAQGMPPVTPTTLTAVPQTTATVGLGSP